MSLETTRIKELEAQLAAAKAAIPSHKLDTLTVKIGDKGTINVYGLGRFPVCLYKSQLDKLIPLITSEAFKQFLVDNSDKIAVKA